MINKEEGFNNPLPYIFLTFIMALLSYEIYSKNRQIAIFYVAVFFAMFLYFMGRYVAVILLVFYIAFLVNNIWFYNYIPNSIEEIRVTYVGSYYGKGEIEGRIVNLSNINSELKIGHKIIAEGNFESNLNIVNGIIGDFKINEYIKQNDDFISKLYRRREYIYEKINEKLDSRKSSLITSVAFGYKENLDSDHKTLMKSLGISHAISISGMHLALIYGILLKICGVKISLMVTFFYMMFTGAPPSALRAYIMIFIISIGKGVKRQYNPVAAISMAGIIILLFKPYEIFNLGFILSFAATLGIILFNNNLNKGLYKLPNKIRNTVSICLSAQVFSFPIIVLTFGEVSLNFIIGNIIVIPFIYSLVILGNLLLVFEVIPEVFNYILYMCSYIVKYIDIIMYKLENISVDLVYFHYTSAYFYGALLITYYFYKKGFKRFIYFPMLMAVYIGVIIYSPFPVIRYYKDGALLVSYRGERVLIQTCDNLNEEKIKAVAVANNIYSDVNKAVIGNEIIIEKQSNNFILSIGDSKYLLFVNYEKINNEYDIIDFRKGDLEEVVLFNENITKNR